MILRASEQLGFLTGEENREMMDAHVRSTLYVGEPFRHTGEYFDFGDQEISTKIKEEMPVMMKNRLSPPPNEVYSLHRKLSGTYLMCIKLGSRVKSKQMFEKLAEDYLKEKELRIN